MKIRHYDPDLGKWVISAASNAEDLELTNPAYTDGEGGSVSINQGITKLTNKVKKIEDNLAWIYLNGARGGGSGPGTGGTDSIKIEIREGTTIYTSTSTVSFNLMINNGTVSRSFTIVIKDASTGRTLSTLRKFSLTNIPIELSNLTNSVNLEISAYDGSGNTAIPLYVSVIYGAINLSLQRVPDKTIIRGAISDVPANFTLTNNISGGSSKFIFKVNDTLIDEVEDIKVSPRSLTYNIRNIIFGDLFNNVTAGDRFNFEAYASTVLNDTELKSNIIKFDVTVTEANSLVIVTNDISDKPDEHTEYPQGSQLNFNYYLSYAPSKYSTFNIDYIIKSSSDNILLSGRIPNVNKGVNSVFSVSTVNLDVNEEDEFIIIELSAHAISDPSDITAKYTKILYARITESEKVELYANNDIETLLAYYSRVTGFPAASETIWNYPLSKSGRFPYSDVMFNLFPEGVNLRLSKTNGYSTGFINNTDNINNIPGLVLNGEATAKLEVAQQMFPDYEIGQFGFFQPKGFNISTTYKAESQTDTSAVIMSIGRYINDSLDSGIEINLERVKVKIGTADTIEVKLPMDEIVTVDIDVSLMGETSWYFKIYVNGVLSAVSRVEQHSIDWTFEQDIYYGCRNDKGVLSRYSNVTIYDIKLYTSSQTEYAIVQNYMSAYEQANLLNGQIDESLDAELRSKNLFDDAGNCLIWDKANNDYYQGDALYNILSAQMEINTPYPIVMVRETSNSPTNFKAFSTAIFTAEERHDIMDKTFPCEITFKNKLGEALINTPNGVSSSDGVRIGLQGTSSLSYNSKNFELYMGDKDPSGKQQLFQPVDDWLPENQFTLKADVMDSAHVNNVVVGKIINGVVENKQGEKISPLDPTPPMLLPDSVFSSSEMAREVRGKIKHTSDGFPCLVFVNYAPNERGVRETRFMGIYNFNLGRYAYFNLGLKILTDYQKEVEGGQPTLIEDYSEIQTYWNTGNNEGAYSIEINQNQSSQGAFQQDHMSIVKFMGDVVYSSRDEDQAYDAVRQFYTQAANMPLSQTQKYTMDDAGQTPTKPIPGEFYTHNLAYYNFDLMDQYMNWNNANAYFILAIVFGMVDSMCKNLTLRNWGGNVWYTTFYDMDTSFGLNNAGQDIVEYWSHLHRWYNIQSQDSGITTFTLERNYTDNNVAGDKQYYASSWNRIWEILENLPILDSGNVAENRTTLERMYADLRLNLFPEPEKFIDEYYKTYTEQTGSIMFNYDYKIKYLKIAQTYTEEEGYKDSTDFSQLKFLHGNRVIHVKDWFKKRILFLDSVYGVTDNRSNIDISVNSPINTSWADNKATGTGTQTLFTVGMKTGSKMLYRWSYDKTVGSFWLDENTVNAVVPTPGGETIIYMYANEYITQFNDFKNYPWTSLTSINLPALKELDLSGLRNIPGNNFMYPMVYDKQSGVGLKSIESLNLSGVQLLNSSTYTLDISDCDYLSYLNVSSSNITNVKLSDTAVLKYYNLSNTAIRSLTISNQAFLEDLIIDNCDDLETVTINNCNSLRTLNLPRNVKTLNITNCELLDSLTLPYNGPVNEVSGLIEINIDNCPSLKMFDVTRQNNPTLAINLIGAKNLETLNLSQTNTNNIILPPLDINGEPNFTSLRDLNISNTDIKNLNFNGVVKDYLDLTNFTDFQTIRASNNLSLTEVRVNNIESKPINLESQCFYNCNKLTRVKGNYQIVGTEVFKHCSAFKINDESTYETSLPFEFLEGDDVTNISINTSSLRGVFENSGISYNDFKKVVYQFNNNIVDVEGMFKGCYGIDGSLWRDLFVNSRNITRIKEFLSNTNIKGTLISSASNYSSDDESTWGTLDYLPRLNDLESAFEYTKLEWIDDNLFKPKNGISYPFVNIDRLFRGCQNLKICENSRDVNKTEGFLTSKTFFTNLNNLIAVYPKNVFDGCRYINMNITNEGDNTYLFHTKKTANYNILDNSLYNGVTLHGEIKVNVFGGITNDLGEFRIPNFTSIQSPFTPGNISINLGEMGSIFRNINNTLLQAIGIFSGLKLIGDKSIPDDIFKGCINLNSISSLFSNLDIDNNGQIYEFPNSEIFKDTISLNDISNLFNNTNKVKIKLLSEGFKNCKLENVSGAFSSSGVFGIIPYRLFFMVDGNNIRKSIKNMSNLFTNCWLLGYDKTREIDTSIILKQDEFEIRKTTWYDGIPLTQGNKVDYKLDVTDLKKSYNYDRNEVQMIPNPDYIANPEDQPEDYNQDTPEMIFNPDYNPGEYAFDIWYLDGYGWENAYSSELGLQEQKDRLYKYFKYDEYQKQSIADNLDTEWYIDTNQNYMIPTDLFRYCAKDPDLTQTLKGLSWYNRFVETNQSTGDKYVRVGNTIEGLRGRLPVKLFESLTDTEQLRGVFSDVLFDPFYGLRGKNVLELQRGLMYPVDLFKYNTQLTNVKEFFSGTKVPVGVDVNPDLFKTNPRLRDISYLWFNCEFDTRPYDTSSFNVAKYSQFDFEKLFSSNIRITNAAYLFAIASVTDTNKGLKIIDDSLLKTALNIENITAMFYYNQHLSGSVPTFNSSIYTALNSYEGYLQGVNRGGITNSNLLEPRLIPSNW